MRHGNKKAKLGRPADQRKALLRSLTTELLRHGKIKTTKVSLSGNQTTLILHELLSYCSFVRHHNGNLRLQYFLLVVYVGQG